MLRNARDGHPHSRFPRLPGPRGGTARLRVSVRQGFVTRPILPSAERAAGKKGAQGSIGGRMNQCLRLPSFAVITAELKCVIDATVSSCSV